MKFGGVWGRDGVVTQGGGGCRGDDGGHCCDRHHNGRVEPDEILLTGGNMGTVTRLGGEVRRPTGPWTANIHRLLQAYADAGIEATPRALGFTADGRERLSFLPGTVANEPAAWLWTDAVLVDTARLVRRLHDASVRLATLADGWRSPVHTPAEVVCHNDVAPYNLVFTDGRVTGLIDFDYASPGPRAWELAYLAYTLVPLSSEPVFTESERKARLNALVSAYGTRPTADEVLALVPAKLDELAGFSDRMADELGKPELHLHASGYWADAARLLQGRIAAD